MEREEISFDIISDLCLGPNEIFKMNNIATSLYCVVAGNISSDTRTIIQTLSHISKFYHGVLYIPGSLEYENIKDIEYRTQELEAICDFIDGVSILYRNVAIIDGVAIAGINGWGFIDKEYDISTIARLHEREDDIVYLEKSIEKLQLHLDVKKIILVSSIIPNVELYYGEMPSNHWDYELTNCLISDTEKKISHWVFGGSNNIVDVKPIDINYISNPYVVSKNNYWPKRISIKI